MAVFVLTNASITVNSVDLSAYATSITLNYETDSVEVTAMGATGHKFTGGLQNISLDVTLTKTSRRHKSRQPSTLSSAARPPS